MKEDSIMGRRQLLHNIYSTIDETFKNPSRDMDKDTLKTNNFIASLNQLTSKFNSRAFLKKPLQEMLKEFFDPSMLDEDSDDETFPLILSSKKSRKRLNRSGKRRDLSKNKCKHY